MKRSSCKIHRDEPWDFFSSNTRRQFSLLSELWFCLIDFMVWFKKCFKCTIITTFKYSISEIRKEKRIISCFLMSCKIFHWHVFYLLFNFYFICIGILAKLPSCLTQAHEHVAPQIKSRPALEVQSAERLLLNPRTAVCKCRQCNSSAVWKIHPGSCSWTIIAFEESGGRRSLKVYTADTKHHKCGL